MVAQALWNAIAEDNPTNLNAKLEAYWQQGTATLVGCNPLSIACGHGKTNCAMELIQLCPRLAREKDEDGSTPMLLSCQNGLVSVVEALAKLDPTLCNESDNDLRTPLQVAIMNGHEEVVRVIVRAHPDSLRRVNSHQEAALHLALKQDQRGSFLVLVEEILNHKMEELLNWKDREGNTVLQIATFRKQVEFLELLLHHRVRPFLEVNSRNRNGLTALDLHNQNDTNRVDQCITDLLHRAGAKQGFHTPSSSFSQLLRESPSFRKMMLASISSMTASTHSAVFIFVASAAYACLFNLDTVFPQTEHDLLNFSTLSVQDLILHSHRIPDVFFFLVLNAIIFLGSVILILINTWSLVGQWSICYRAVPLAVMAALCLSYALVVNKTVPRFFVKVCGYKVPSFWVVWLFIVPLIFAILIWVGVKLFLSKLRSRNHSAANKIA